MGELDRVMVLSDRSAYDLPEDRGASGLWQQLQKLQTTASVLHVVAHPDDEHGGVLTYLGRGEGARVAQLSLTRGEAGANVIGSELFDALGLVRTEELLLAGAYYGLDDLYFSTMIDYGFSKTLEEAMQNWGRENVLRDVVRAIRINRPLVVLGRFHGTDRDGHGHHHTAGLIPQEAFRAAGDPSRFPEQIDEEGLRPWQPRKVYRGGLQEDEDWNVRIDAGTFSPWLGQSYRNMASRGLSYQRSQTSGVFRQVAGPYLRHYERMDASGVGREDGLFDGIDTSLSGLFEMLGVEDDEAARSLLREVDAHVAAAAAAFDIEDPAAAVVHLAPGLDKLRRAMVEVDDQPDVRFNLQIKERQFEQAIGTALGIRLDAVGVRSGTAVSDSPWAAPATMGVAVPGQRFRVDATLLNASSRPVGLRELRLEASSQWDGDSGGTIGREAAEAQLGANQTESAAFEVTVPQEARVSDRYFYRNSIAESRYQVRDFEHLHLPQRLPVLTAAATYEVEGVPVEIRETVRRRASNIPFGYELRALKIAPAVAVNVQPAMRMVPSQQLPQSIDVEVEIVNNQEGGLRGDLRLEVPEGWNVEPAEQPFSFEQAGERRSYVLRVDIPDLEDRVYTVAAVAAAQGREYQLGYDAIAHPDNDIQYLYRDAVTQVRGIDVEIVPGLQVGYVMGVGDEVPSGIEQLGADVELLSTEHLATADLSAFDAIVVGTRAYAVRQDLWTYNRRLLEFAQDGGHLIVLYQTPEMIPNEVAPFPADLPQSAEEVSEEDAPVRILAPDHPVFNEPNAITMADFEGWVEQRGSKFFAGWDDAYTALIESHDQGQGPQEGGWLTAEYGNGRYTYFAYAVHRQLPYAVPGAYRIFANVLSLDQLDAPQ
jgi:LmbE family N-acetylglucosaminyl deacetylase